MVKPKPNPKPLLLAAALLALLSATARADDPATLLARARTEVDQLRFDVAQKTLATALDAGGADRTQLIAIYRLAGEVAGSLDQPDVARGHFAHLLALDPTVTLEAGVSPKISAPFAAARKAARGPLRAHDASTSDRIAIDVVADPLSMVARARLYIQPAAGAPQTRILDGTQRFESPLPAGAHSWSLSLLDAHGNQLLVLRGDVAAAAPPPTHVDSGAGGTGGPAWYARWYPWAGLALGLGVTGTAMGLWGNAIEQDLRDLNASSTDHDFTEARALERKGRRVTLTANLCFAGAGAAAVASAIFFLRGRHQNRTEVAVVPIEGGALLVFSRGRGP